jgi:iron(III) transport system permease protein
VALGRWRWPALAFCGTVVLLALVLPVGVLVFWLSRGLAAGEQLSNVWQSAWNSVYVSGLAAGVAVLAALPVAVLAVRFPGKVASLTERVTYVGFALPGIVLALSLVFFGSNYAPALYQTLFLLIFAYVVHFLPLAVGAIRASCCRPNRASRRPPAASDAAPPGCSRPSRCRWRVPGSWPGPRSCSSPR